MKLKIKEFCGSEQSEVVPWGEFWSITKKINNKKQFYNYFHEWVPDDIGTIYLFQTELEAKQFKELTNL